MQEIAINWQVFGSVFALLLLFGCLYATLVNYMARKGVEDGQTAWLVVVGVAVTLVGSAFVVGVQVALLVAGCFVASGLPMVTEYVWRNWHNRQKDHEQARVHNKDLL